MFVWRGVVGVFVFYVTVLERILVHIPNENIYTHGMMDGWMDG